MQDFLKFILRISDYHISLELLLAHLSNFCNEGTWGLAHRQDRPARKWRKKCSMNSIVQTDIIWKKKECHVLIVHVTQLMIQCSLLYIVAGPGDSDAENSHASKSPIDLTSLLFGCSTSSKLLYATLFFSTFSSVSLSLTRWEKLDLFSLFALLQNFQGSWAWWKPGGQEYL